jgi:CTP:molybdopterin cytidylyltransferase MocA
MTMPAIILAAGASRRLGQPKQLIQIGDEILLERTIRVVREAGIEAVVVVLGAHREEILARSDLSRVNVIENPDWAEGIASSICAGVSASEAADPKASEVMLLACDQPALTAEHLRAMVDASRNGAAIVASLYAGATGIPAIFPASQFERLLALRGDQGARLLLREPQCEVIPVPFDGGEVDVDTPADLAAVTALNNTNAGGYRIRRKISLKRV